MEAIEVYRGSPEHDMDGNLVQGQPRLVGTLQALVAPTQQTTTTSEDSLPVEYDYTLYIRSHTPTGLKESDLLKVRGHLTGIVGSVAVWHDTAGKHVGDVVTVSIKEG